MRPLGVVTGRLYGMAHEFLVLLPQLVIALVVVALTWLVARIGSTMVRAASAGAPGCAPSWPS